MKRRLTNSLYGAIFFSLVGFFFWVIETVPEVKLPSSTEPVEFYANQNGDDLRTTVIHAIDSAKQSVMLVIYTLTDPGIIASLQRKSNEGIPVTVILDGNASKGIDRKMRGNVRIVKRYAKGLTHQKILLIDGKSLLLGSANMTGESLKMHGNLMLGFESPALGKMVEEKLASLNEDGDRAIIPHQSFVMDGQKVEMWFLPDDRGAIERIKQLMRSAKKTIRVAMFTWTRYDFADEIVAAAYRGVKVQIVLDNNQGQGASAKIVKLLAKKHIPIRLSSSAGLLHHKFMIVDDTILVNGSANWTKAAFTQNDDCFIVLQDLTDKQKEQLTRLWSIVWAESKPPDLR
jgi:phosphatidylserine/phosphatidylglycerophosphate/cardiolipin synthase-like enzyme